VHRFLSRGDVGYCGRAALIQSFSAVTGACLVVRKSLYEAVDGLNEVELQVACNDIDFCLRLGEAGYRTIWTPYAELYHHESASRGFDDTPEKQARSAKEVAYMKQRWENLLLDDPAYNPNLTLDAEDFGLAWPPRVPPLIPTASTETSSLATHVRKKLHVLLEMRPALDGFAGIPQETRLLFRGMSAMTQVEIEGLLQTSTQFLQPSAQKNLLSDSAIDSHAGTVASLSCTPSKKRFDIIDLYIKRRRIALWFALCAWLFPHYRAIKTSIFKSQLHADFIWQRIFSKTLPATDFAIVTPHNYRVCSAPWNVLQTAGLYGLKLWGRAQYPRLDTHDVDIFITQTPYPAQINPETTLVVRYHDALPILMPHMFPDSVRHHAAHFHALQSNVRSGAYFSCVSEATRQDLLSIFPEVADRCVTIHNMVSHEYFDTQVSTENLPSIIKSRLNIATTRTHPSFKDLLERDNFYQHHLAKPLRYLLMVSTIEPRKNHLTLLTAWQTIRSQYDPNLKLVIVGSLGWDVEPIVTAMRASIDQGSLFMLCGVPASELRVLYQHAAVTVCPSIAEGFDYSGVETMCSGGLTVASDIAVHREIYADAAEYFETTLSSSLVNSLVRVLYATDAVQRQNALRTQSKIVSMRYRNEAILPQWEKFLRGISRT
jgi:glycosyltransferase involved in cell wall biosynthesis